MFKESCQPIIDKISHSKQVPGEQSEPFYFIKESTRKFHVKKLTELLF